MRDVGDADAERQWLRELARGPIRGLRRWVERRRLVLIGRGYVSDVFAAGPDHVLRLTASGDECDLIEQILRGHRGALVGWPRIFEAFQIPEELRTIAGADFRCVVVLERVRVATALPDRMALDLNQAMLEIDRIHRLWHDEGGRLPVRSSFAAMWGGWTEPSRRPLDARTAAYASELYNGLLAIDRWAASDWLDVKLGNVGVNARGHAVWVDFGV